jgi:hypothetical protein
MAEQELPAGIELAQAFSAALNGHNVEALVALFTEEDAGPTVAADRYAWQKFEIRVWAERQVAGNIHVEAYDYRISEHGVLWEADVYRDDWGAIGVTPLPVSNAIWVHHGKLASFTSTPRNPHDAQLLGGAWQPDAEPERRPI